MDRVMNLRPRDHVTPLFGNSALVASPPRMIKFKLCLLVHKIQIGRSLNYLSDLLTLAADVPGRPSVRSSSRGHFIMPRIQVASSRTELSLFLLPEPGTDYQWNLDTYVQAQTENILLTAELQN